MLPRLPSPEVDLETLVRAVQAALATATLPMTDARTSEALDVRTFRYYRTLGLVSAPLRYDGPRAIFGELHFLQALATKALQRHGLSLAEVGRRLTRLAVSELQNLVSEALRSQELRKAEFLAPTPARAPSACAPAPATPPAAQPGHALVLDLAPGLRVHADLAQAAAIASQLPQVRRRFEESLQLLARLAPASIPPHDPASGGEQP